MKIRKKVILSTLLLTSLFIIGCPSEPMNCVPLYQCVDGTMMDYCSSFDGTSVAYKYHGQYYRCDYYDYYNYDECYQALMAMYSCLGYISSDFGADDRNHATNESNVKRDVE